MMEMNCQKLFCNAKFLASHYYYYLKNHCLHGSAGRGLALWKTAASASLVGHYINYYGDMRYYGENKLGARGIM